MDNILLYDKPNDKAFIFNKKLTDSTSTDIVNFLKDYEEGNLSKEYNDNYK